MAWSLCNRRTKLIPLIASLIWKARLSQKGLILLVSLFKPCLFGLHLPDFTCNHCSFFMLEFLDFTSCWLLSSKYILSISTITLSLMCIIYCAIYIDYYNPYFYGCARGVMVIITGNGQGDMSSNPGRDWLHFT